MKNRKKGKKITDKSASIERLPPSILAKLPKEVKEISKFFKMTSLTNENKNNSKLYTQASYSGSNTREVFKIKKAFPNLQVKKIENIQKIINGDGKSKLKVIMTIKGLSRKQVIVPMNNDNKMSFIEDSSNHVTNLNRTLKNIKSDIMVDFICQEQSGITIITNKVASPLDLQTIEKYVKSVNYIEANGVEVL